MPRIRIHRLGLSLVVAIMVLSPAGVAAQTQESEAGPESVVRAFMDALSSGDAEGAAAMFTDTAIRVRQGTTGLCSRRSPCVGREDILASLQAQVPTHECQTIVDATASGNVVTSRFEARNDNFRSAGTERILVLFMALIEDGKIAALYALPDQSDPETVASNPTAAGTGPARAPIPNPLTPCS